MKSLEMPVGIQQVAKRYRGAEEAWGTSLEVQWLRLQASSAGDTDLIPGRRIKILHTAQEAWESLAPHGKSAPL